MKPDHRDEVHSYVQSVELIMTVKTLAGYSIAICITDSAVKDPHCSTEP